jgi:hypothetical protein
MVVVLCYLQFKDLAVADEKDREVTLTLPTSWIAREQE